MSYEVEAWVCLNGGADVEMKVTVPDDATEEQIDEAVKQAAMNHLDWGWEDPDDIIGIEDTYPCGCCMCCGCMCDWEYELMWEDEEDE